MAKGKVKFSVYTDPELKEQLDKIAEEEERSLAYITSKAIKFYLDNRDKKIEEPVNTTVNNDEANVFINTNFNPNQIDEF